MGDPLYATHANSAFYSVMWSSPCEMGRGGTAGRGRGVVYRPRHWVTVRTLKHGRALLPHSDISVSKYFKV